VIRSGNPDRLISTEPTHGAEKINSCRAYVS